MSADLCLAHTMTEDEFKAKKFGLPKSKKYPMPDAAHVKSAIKFFNYVNPSNEKELAKSILARMEEYGIDPESINVGDNNRFKKYIDKTSLKHHGIKGMKWGIRRYQNSDGSLTPEGEKRYHETKALMDRADRYDRLAQSLNSQSSKNKSRSQKMFDSQRVKRAKRKASNIRKNLDQDMVSRVNAEKQSVLAKKKYDADRQYHNSPGSRRTRFMEDAMRDTFGSNKPVDYMDIYREMSKTKRFKKLLDSKDNDDYKEAEAAWLKKHGYYDSYLDAIKNGYKDNDQTSLKHHGIKGMKWGVRRYQNPDGSYTDEGRRRYGHEIAAKQEVEKLKKEYQKVYNSDTSFEKLDEINRSLVSAKDAVSLAKTRDRVANEDPSKKSAARLADEKKYQKQGLSKEDAAIAAYNKERTKKLLMIAGGVALAGAAYAAYKYHDNNMDRFIDSNTTLFRLARSGSDTLHDGFYATSSKSDARKYVGLMAKQMDAARVFNPFVPKNDWHQKTIKSVVGNVKIAGDKTGRSILGEMLRSDSGLATKDLRSAMEQAKLQFTMAGGVTQAARIQAGIKDLDRGKLDSRRLYNAMNMAMPMADNDGRFRKSFTDALKKHGYGGIVDVNDRSFSGYNSKRPMILFDSNQFKVEGNRKVGKAEINRNYAAEMLKTSGRIGAKVGAAYGGYKVVRNQRNAQRVRNYRREHPNTKLTDAQILEALKNR